MDIICIIRRILCFLNKASYGRWTGTAVATLKVIVQILVFKLNEWTGFLRNEINGFSDNLAFALNKSIERLVNTARVVGRNLGVVIEQLFNTINELFAADLIAATSDTVGGLVTKPSNVLKNFVRAIVAVRVEASNQSTTSPDNVCGEQQEKIRLPIKNNLVRQNSNVRPKMSQGKCLLKSILINQRTTTKCEENPKKYVKIITNTPQAGILKIEGLIYEDLTPNAGPVASCKLDKTAEWRREKFSVDNEATVTPGIAGGLDNTSSSANCDRMTAGRDEASTGQYKTTATRRPRAQKDTMCRRHVTDACSIRPGQVVDPPLPDPRYLSHGPLGPLVGPPSLGPGHLSHGHSESIARPPLSTSEKFRHTCPETFMGPALPTSVKFWHTNPEPFAVPLPPTPEHFQFRRPGPFAGPPLLTSGKFRLTRPEIFARSPPPTLGHFQYTRPGPFAGPPLLTSGKFRHTRPGPFAGPLPPTPEHFQCKRPGPFAGPPIRTGFMVNTVLYGIRSAMVYAYDPGHGPLGPLSTFSRDMRRH